MRRSLWQCGLTQKGGCCDAYLHESIARLKYAETFVWNTVYILQHNRRYKYIYTTIRIHPYL